MPTRVTATHSSVRDVPRQLSEKCCKNTVPRGGTNHGEKPGDVTNHGEKGDEPGVGSGDRRWEGRILPA